jgi:hypothetical protein
VGVIDRTRVGRWPARSGGVLALMLLGSRALAAEASHAAAEGAGIEQQAERRVEIALVGQVGQIQDLRSLLVEWLGSARSRVIVRRQRALDPDEVVGASSSDDVLRVWVVLASEQLARIYFADTSDGRFLVRDVPLRHGLDELGRERVAQVLTTSGRAFLEHRVSSTVQQVAESFEEPSASYPVEPAESPGDGPRRVTARPAEQPRRRAARRPHAEDSDGRSRLVADGGVFYGIAWKGQLGLGHGPGIALAVGSRPLGWRWAVTAKAQYQWPYRARSDTVEVRVQTTALRVGARAQRPLAHWFTGGIEAGCGLDVVSYAGHELPSQPLARVRAGGESRPVAFLAARSVLTAGPPDIALELSGTVPLVDAHYDVLDSGEQRAEITAWRVQPGVALEVSWQ